MEVARTEFGDHTDEVKARKTAFCERVLPGSAVAIVEKVEGNRIDLAAPFGGSLVRVNDLLWIENDICKVSDIFCFLGGTHSMIVDVVPDGCEEGSLVYLKQMGFVKT